MLWQSWKSVTFEENFLGNRRQMQSMSCSSKDQAPPSSVAQTQVPEEHLQSLDPCSSLDYFQITLSWTQSDHLPVPPCNRRDGRHWTLHLLEMWQQHGPNCYKKHGPFVCRGKVLRAEAEVQVPYKVMIVAWQEGEQWLPAGDTASPGVSPSKAFVSIPTWDFSHLMGRAESADWEALNARGEEMALVSQGACQMLPPQ